MSGSASCSGSWEALRKRCWCVVCKRRIRVESVLSREETRKEIEDSIKVKVCTKLEVMFATHIAHNVNELPTLDGGFTRTEVVSTQLKKAGAGLNARFSNVAVCFARFAIAAKLETKLINQV